MFESVDASLKCSHSKTIFAVALSCGAVGFSLFLHNLTFSQFDTGIVGSEKINNLHEIHNSHDFAMQTDTRLDRQDKNCLLYVRQSQ